MSVFRGGLLVKRMITFFWGEGGAGGRGEGGCSFYIKNKLKHEIFDDKKSFDIVGVP